MRDIRERRNIEIKARCTDLAAARETAQRLAGESAGVLRQTDTYFAARRGRLKLREFDDGAPVAELIAYDRPNDPSARLSRYFLFPVDDPDALRGLLAAALGVVAVVRKRRELFLYENVRIHLDAVEKLGNFVELEAVLSDAATETESVQQLERLTRALNIRPEDRLAGSYGELAGNSPSGDGGDDAQPDPSKTPR